MPIEYGILTQPKAPQNETQVIQTAPQRGGSDDIMGGIRGLLGGVFGNSNPVSQANSAISQTMAQTPLQGLAKALLPSFGQTSAVPQPLGQNGSGGLLGGLKQALGNDSAAPNSFQQYQQNLQNQGKYPQKVGLAPGSALPLIQKFEGYSSKPYWDVNAYRAGYGSDTVTYADGKIAKIRPGMQVTQADAQRDLERRTAEFSNHAATQVGVKQWQALPPNAQAALTSVTYNYGSLPGSVVKAVQTGNIQTIAQSVANLGSHNKGINRNRRNQEAALILNGSPGAQYANN